MDSKLRNQLISAIHRRSLALATITDRSRVQDPPDVALTFIANNLIMTLCAVLGEDLLKDTLRRLYGGVSEEHGICRYCREHPYVEAKGMCESCWKHLEWEDAQMKHDALMEALAGDKPQ